MQQQQQQQCMMCVGGRSNICMTNVGPTLLDRVGRLYDCQTLRDHKSRYKAVYPLSNICEIICPILFALTHYANICVKMSGINYSTFLSNN